MIDLYEVEDTIAQLEAKEESMYVCERLAWLYIVRDHLRPVREETRTTQDLAGSEFLEVASGVNYPALMQILDDHMSALKVVQPREYNSVMDKIRHLR